MALFDKKTEEKKPKAVKAPKAKAEKAPVKGALPSAALKVLRPRITEKATLATEHNVYVFEVTNDATKIEVKEAMKALYKVDPIKVNMVRMRPRDFVSRMRNRKGTKPGFKKAYVYLKKGDSIELV